jgi:membrane protein required for colicin V production
VNWIDTLIIGMLIVSAFLAFMRGFVREVLGVVAWIGAVALAAWSFPVMQPRFRELIENPDISDPIAFGVVFLVTLIVLSLLANLIGKLVRKSMLNGLDRTLGVVFGFGRGVALVAVAYILGGMVVATDRWPSSVLDARSLPLAYRGAAWVISFVPEEYRPKIYPPPGPQTRAADLLTTPPQGRAIGSP